MRYLRLIFSIAVFTTFQAVADNEDFDASVRQLVGYLKRGESLPSNFLRDVVMSPDIENIKPIRHINYQDAEEKLTAMPYWQPKTVTDFVKALQSVDAPDNLKNHLLQYILFYW